MTLPEAINALPKDRGELHRLLLKEGIKGVRLDASRCVLARKLRKDTGERVYVSCGRASTLTGTTYYRMPSIFRDFEAAFDQGAYPDLEEGYDEPTS